MTITLDPPQVLLPDIVGDLNRRQFVIGGLSMAALLVACGDDGDASAPSQTDRQIWEFTDDRGRPSHRGDFGNRMRRGSTDARTAGVSATSTSLLPPGGRVTLRTGCPAVSTRVDLRVLGVSAPFFVALMRRREVAEL